MEKNALTLWHSTCSSPNWRVRRAWRRGQILGGGRGTFPFETILSSATLSDHPLPFLSSYWQLATCSTRFGGGWSTRGSFVSPKFPSYHPKWRNYRPSQTVATEWEEDPGCETGILEVLLEKGDSFCRMRQKRHGPTFQKQDEKHSNS